MLIFICVLFAIFLGAIAALFRNELSEKYKKVRKHHQAKKMAVLYALKYPPKRQFRIEVKPSGIDSISYNLQYRYLDPRHGQSWNEEVEFDNEAAARKRIKELKMSDLEEQIRNDKSAIEYIDC
jgi:hypothetical protein